MSDKNIIGEIFGAIIGMIVTGAVWAVVFGWLLWILVGWGACWTFGPMLIAAGIPFDPFWVSFVFFMLPPLFFVSLHVCMGREPIVLWAGILLLVFAINLWWIPAFFAYPAIENYNFNHLLDREQTVEFLEIMMEYYEDHRPYMEKLVPYHNYYTDVEGAK